MHIDHGRNIGDTGSSYCFAGWIASLYRVPFVLTCFCQVTKAPVSLDRLDCDLFEIGFWEILCQAYDRPQDKFVLWLHKAIIII